MSFEIVVAFVVETIMTAERRTADGSDARTRITQFLEQTGLRKQGAKAVPLTGDASDRRYFRVLLRDAPSQVLAVHPGPVAFDAVPFVNVARLLSAMPVPVPRILACADALGIMALEDLGDVTLRRPDGELAPGERRIGDLAVASI